MTALSYMHASALVIGEKGLLILGPSRAGKSRLVASLMRAAVAEGRFSRLIGDDRVGLMARNGRLVAAGHPAIAGLIERRGLGIRPAETLSPAVIGHVVDLVATPPRMPEAADSTIRLEGVDLPYLQVGQGQSGADQAALVFFWLSG